MIKHGKMKRRHAKRGPNYIISQQLRTRLFHIALLSSRDVPLTL
jgi:hypothetical protein